MKILIFILSFILLPLSFSHAATIYIDGSMGADCTSGNYSIASRNCTGSDGNAYNDTLAAFNASANGDTIYFRPGSITVNNACPGITIKQGQTWAQYTGDTARSTTITGGSGCDNVFRISFNDVTIRDLTIVGGTQMSIRGGEGLRPRIINNDFSGFNTAQIEGGAAIGFLASGDLFDGEITDNYIHGSAGGTSDTAGINITSGNGGLSSNITISGNRIEGTNYKFGVWMDVSACDPAFGATPCTIEDNYIQTPTRNCFLAEIGSTATWRRNICDRPASMGIYLNTRDRVNTASKIQNNTFYQPGEAGIWIGAGGAGTSSAVTNLLVENNIVYDSGSTYPHLSVDEFYISNTTNRYRNNLFFSPDHNMGICWGDATLGTSPGCDIPPATQYADSSAGISSWQAAAPSGVASGNIAGDPLFANPAGEDFRLCTASGVPHASCTGASPAIDTGRDIGVSYNGSNPDMGAIETAGTPTRNRAVTISSPLDGSTVPRRSNVTIEAEFEPDITSVTYAVNDKELNCGDLATACNWRVPNPPNRNYTISVMVEDAENNTGIDQVNVRSVR